MSLALSGAQRDDIVSRHKAAIDGSLQQRLTTIAVVAGLLGLLIYGLTTLRSPRSIRPGSSSARSWC